MEAERGGSMFYDPASEPKQGRSLPRVWFVLVAIVAAFTLFVGTAVIAAATPRPANPSTVSVTGTLANGTGAVTGVFDVNKFTASGTQLLATGTFTGTITDAAGAVLASGTQTITMAVDLASSSGSCQILHLTLGPLDLNLLGLQVHLDRIVLDITAQSGPGNLLGNLLCAIAGLLDANTALSAIVSQIAMLLNRILGILG
jgi:hypothetical protein